MREGINSIAMIKPSKVEGEEMVPQPKGEDKPRLLITFSEGIRGEKYVEARWGKNKPVGIPPGGIPFTSRDDGSSGRKWRLAEVRREEWIGLGKEWRVEVEGGECISKAINEYDETNKWRGVLVGERLDRDRRAMEMLKGMVKPGEGVLWLGAKGEGKEIEEVEGVKVHWVDSPHELALIMENGVDSYYTSKANIFLGKRNTTTTIHVAYALKRWLCKIPDKYGGFKGMLCVPCDNSDDESIWVGKIMSLFSTSRSILLLRSIGHKVLDGAPKRKLWTNIYLPGMIVPGVEKLGETERRFLAKILQISDKPTLSSEDHSSPTKKKNKTRSRSLVTLCITSLGTNKDEKIKSKVKKRAKSTLGKKCIRSSHPALRSIPIPPTTISTSSHSIPN